MDERLKFIAQLLDGQKMAALCREFGISRKTGYKILKRYRDCGVEALTDRSRWPYRHANQLPLQIETLIVRLKQDKPTWCAPKIRERLIRCYPDVHAPAISTVHAVLDRHGLVKPRKGRRSKAQGTALSQAYEHAGERRVMAKMGSGKVSDVKATVRNLRRGHHNLGCVSVILCSDADDRAYDLLRWLTKMARKKKFSVASIIRPATTAEALEVRGQSLQ
jgi:transposase